MDAKRACVIVHEPGSEAGLVGRSLQRRGYELAEVLMTPEPSNPIGSADGLGSPTDYDLIVAMGATYSLTAPERLSTWIDGEIDFLRGADAAGVPVLGVCFGAQALAIAHGGEVVRSDRPQIGWYEVEPDTGYEALRGPWMQWHNDRVEVDRELVEVVAEDDVAIQAFTVRRNLAVQFHPEVDRAHLERWMELGALPEAAKYGIDFMEVLDETDDRVLDSTPRVERLLDFFMEDVSQR